MRKASMKEEPLGADVWKVVAVAVLGPFLSTLDATVVNVSLSGLAAELHTSVGTIQWVTSGYLLALALMLPISGWLVDRIGARSVYLWSFTAFTAASALCGFAWSPGSLIGFRALQGLAGGLLAPMAQMMFARAAGRHLARVMGYASFPILLGPILGPVLAGAILQHASWRWLFFINLPFGALAVLLAALFLKNDRAETRPRSFDLPGFALLSPGLVLFLYGLDHIGSIGGRAALGGAVVLLGMFLGHAHRRRSAAIIDITLFRNKVFSAATLTQFLANGISYGGQMLIPLFLIRACHYSPTRAGWTVMPIGLGMMVTLPMMGALTERFGSRTVASGGACLALLGTLPFVFMAHAGLVPVAVAAALFVRGMGLGAINVPSVAAAYTAIPRDQLPMATTSLNIVQRLGGPVVTTAIATFLAWKFQTDLDSAGTGDVFRAAFGLLAAIHATAIFSALRLPPRSQDPEVFEDARPIVERL